MSTAVITESRIGRVEVTDETITAHLTDGRVISVPLAWSWRLSDATPAQRANWQLIGDGYGVHWPDVDEDISADGMLNGSAAPRPKARATTPKLKGRLTSACSRRAADGALADAPRAADARSLGCSAGASDQPGNIRRFGADAQKRSDHQVQTHGRIPRFHLRDT